MSPSTSSVFRKLLHPDAAPPSGFVSQVLPDVKAYSWQYYTYGWIWPILAVSKISMNHSAIKLRQLSKVGFTRPLEANGWLPKVLSL